MVKEDQVLIELEEITGISLDKRKQAAERELESLWQDERQQPITYNHYYTDNVQNARHVSIRNSLQKATDEATKVNGWGKKYQLSNEFVEPEKLLACLQKRIIIDMDEQACVEALAGLSAYYKASSDHHELSA